VTAANTKLRGGGGVDGAVHAAAGPRLLQASLALAPCPPGRAVRVRHQLRIVLHQRASMLQDQQMTVPDLPVEAPQACAATIRPPVRVSQPHTGPQTLPLPRPRSGPGPPGTQRR